MKHRPAGIALAALNTAIVLGALARGLAYALISTIGRRRRR